VRQVYRIGKAFTFEAAHHLPSLPRTHKCSRPHGHSYRVEVTVTAAELTSPGFVADFADLMPLRDYLAGTLDHQDLNQVLDVEPTSENLARHLHGWCQDTLVLPGTARVEAVRVSETGSAWAEYLPGAAP
jgi:6-pyruvoyltetrahydropterin/6-carboxytetrahydropterin synthase